MNGSSGRSQLKTGNRPTQRNIRRLKPGDTLFEEGSTGRELYIINDGKVGVYQGSSEGEVELAVVDKGNLIGEMSLLDNLPRSATVRALEPTEALVITQQTFQAAVKTVPAWLNSIIKIVISRLRDANKRVNQSVLRDKVHGVVSLMLLLYPVHRTKFGGGFALDYNLVCIEAYYVCRLRKKEIVRLLEQLQKHELIRIEEDAEHHRYVCITDIEVLRLYDEYLTLKSQKKTFKEASAPEEAVTVFSNIAYVAQKSGSETPEGTVLSKSALVEDAQEKNPERLDKFLMELRRRNLINMMPAENDTQIIFDKEVLSRLKKIKEWLPRFEAAG